MIYFTADTHFGHGNIRYYCGRPFNSLAEMNDSMVERWNAIVTSQDHVYHLGDFGFGPPEYLNRIAQRLHGKIHLILGNHDKSVKREPLVRRFTFIKDTHMIKHKFPDGTNIQIWLAHYAHRTWPQWNYGTYHLFGHSHGNMPRLGRSFDCGVDCWNFQPISIDFVHEQLSSVPYKADEKHREQHEEISYCGKSYEAKEQEELDEKVLDEPSKV